MISRISTNRVMKIGLFGGLANNLYLAGKAFLKGGHDVVYIRDRDFGHAISQPIWEDCEFTLTKTQLDQTDSYTYEDWNSIEKNFGWKAPDWFWDPIEQSTYGTNEYCEVESCGLGLGGTDAAIVRKMRECDLLIVSGIKGPILARVSGRPYFVQPFGGDFMIARRLLRQTPNLNWLSRIIGSRWEWEIAKGFNDALAILFHTKHISVDHYAGKIKLPMWLTLPKGRIDALSFYAEISPPVDRLTKLASRRLLSERLLLTDSDKPLHIFAPARVDYSWKNQFLLLKAIRNERIIEHCHFIFAGWGKDIGHFRSLCRDLGISAAFMDGVISKPLLYKLMAASDIVVDNFVGGHYGATGLEAMANGTPIMIWRDDAQFAGAQGQPPVINARTEDEIETALLACIDGAYDLNLAARKVHEWCNLMHSADTLNGQLDALVSKYLI